MTGNYQIMDDFFDQGISNVVIVAVAVVVVVDINNNNNKFV
jgi:hypothetical protein